MIDPNLIEENNFESEVLRVASHLWPEAKNGGNLIIDGQERDGVYVLDEIIHLIECTTSRTKEKAEKDCGKLMALISKMSKQHPTKVAKGWFVTKDEPTADQRTVAIQKAKDRVQAISFEKFQSKMVDVALYRNCRNNYPFGSVRDPSTGESSYNGTFVEAELSNARIENDDYALEKIVIEITSGHKVIIQGHYGVGKSMTMREIYHKLNEKHIRRETAKFPIYINLRDHQGQTDPVEAIERHARNIGFKNPDHLVRSWRAGYTTILLDGYDEIAAFGWAAKGITLRDVRYKSMELLRGFIKQNPKNTGILVAGRSNYFDSLKECETAFGLDSSLLILRLGDFTPEQTETYLQKQKILTKLPDWMPTRPLLLGYLVSRNIITDILAHSGVDSPAEGWDFLLTEICKREAAIEAGLSPETVRELIEGLASHVRQFQNGMGPIYKADLERVFALKCGYPPDDRALILLQRLPGLAHQDQQDGARYFIDHLFASAAKVGEVVGYVNNPYDPKLSIDPRKFQESLDGLSIELASMKLASLDSGQIQDAIIQAKKSDAEVLATDILMTFNFMGKSWTRENLTLSNLVVPILEIKKEVDWSRVLFREVIFKELVLEEMPDTTTAPIFENCIIGRLIGCSDPTSLPTQNFINPMIDAVESTEITTRALLKTLDLAIQVRVGLTILKKLFFQSGSGRQENAFFRGLSTNEQSYVPAILDLLKHEGIILAPKTSKNKVWQPVKSQSNRVRNIIMNKAYKDSLVENMKFIAP